MEGHACMLGSALDQPIQGEALIDLVAEVVIGHRRPFALGAGIGRVLGQSGLKGSSSRCGLGGGALRRAGFGEGSSRGLLGGASGSVCGILTSRRHYTVRAAGNRRDIVLCGSRARELARIVSSSIR